MKIPQILSLLGVVMLGSAVRLSLVRSIPNRNFGDIGGDVVGRRGLQGMVRCWWLWRGE